MRARFGNRWLALAVAATGLVATMPYIALQLVGLEVVIAALGVPLTGIAGELPLVIAFLVLAIVSLWLLNRYYRTRDPLFWMATSSGVLLIASYLVLSLGQGYYSMMLFPFLMTVVLPNSVIRNWPAWLAIYGFMSADRWLLIHWPTTGRYLEYMKFTYGWCLILIVIFCVLYFRYLDAKADGRLDDGIDPTWLKPKEPVPA